jgi:hypothetical protein
LRDVKSSVDKILQKNFLILNDITKDDDEITISRELLEKIGYKLNYFTDYNDNSLVCLYHFVLIEESSNSFIVKKN